MAITTTRTTGAAVAESMFGLETAIEDFESELDITESTDRKIELDTAIIDCQTALKPLLDSGVVGDEQTVEIELSTWERGVIERHTGMTL